MSYITFDPNYAGGDYWLKPEPKALRRFKKHRDSCPICRTGKCWIGPFCKKGRKLFHEWEHTVGEAVRSGELKKGKRYYGDTNDEKGGE